MKHEHSIMEFCIISFTALKPVEVTLI